jgi:hypothetical protein
MPWQHIVILVVWVISAGLVWLVAEHSDEPETAKPQAVISIVTCLVLAILLISGDAALAP